MSSKSNSLLTEIILSNSRQSLGKIYLEQMPQPGSHLELSGKTYAILERHHHYQYKIGGYCLQRISLHVQELKLANEKSLIEGRWVIGDATCRYNAHSEIMRCAVNPEGPCQDCHYYEP
ncbi:DUF6464 family protein [Myxosarcina sp. GI1]|uniref:DUF6464 family protein n=1 Tax=Myxosarcina sp. GI1 TaxID=1541065 RepID=UPI0005639F5B|nr:DUF6464 family protein [Myxosarcina sp. GI1]